jgi:predicted secreted Zn-dependent protease|tara:strand:+ start:270 stop:461 length:192 start_codon:yes stop_codon:yes gene_type:complete
MKVGSMNKDEMHEQISKIEASINERATALIKADPVCARLQGQLDILQQISAAENPEPETVEDE